MKKIMSALCVTMMFITSTAYALECEYAIKPEYSSAIAFKSGTAIVSQNNQIKTIDRFGKINDFLDGKAMQLRGNGLIMVVGANDLAAFFDKNGNQLTDYLYDTHPVINPKTGEKTYKFGYYDGDGKSDLVPYSRGNKYGYINPYGTEVIPPIYDYAYGFINGVAKICAEGKLSEYGMYVEGKYGFIKEDGTEILPANSYWIASEEYDYGYSNATNGTVPQILVDRHGNAVVTDEIGYAKIDAKYIAVQDVQGRKGIVDKNRNFIIPLDYYDSIENFNGDFFIINYKKIVNNRNEVIYEAGEDETINPLYLNIYDKSQFARLAKSSDGNQWVKEYNIVDCNGNVLLDTTYSTLYDLGEGLIYGQNLDGNYLFDYRGKLLCEINGNNCSECVDGLFAMLDFETSKWGYALNPIKYPKVYVNGEKLISDVYPKIENNRTLVPMRAVFESLDAEVEWDDSTRTVKAKKGENTISLQIGSNILYKNGEGIEIDVPAKIEYNRTLVPLRAVSESLECVVEWDAENRVVDITTK